MKTSALKIASLCLMTLATSQLAQAQGIGFGSFGPVHGGFGPGIGIASPFYGYGPRVSLSVGPSLSLGRVGYGSSYPSRYGIGYGASRSAYRFGTTSMPYYARRPAIYRSRSLRCR